MASKNDEFPCKLLLFASITLLITAVQAHDADALVNTRLGSIQGVTQVIPNAHGRVKAIHKFLGIPYAMAPIGNLRFAPPQPHRGWKDKVYEATSFRPICMQMIRHYNISIRQAWDGFSEMDNMSEDCLYLNIYTPINASKAAQLYPVLAYIHGGGFFAGTPVQVVSPGEYLPLRGVILVSIQYRLGTFGFFSTGDSTAPGNYGMLDQVEALRWVQENIDSFGGDPRRSLFSGRAREERALTFIFFLHFQKDSFTESSRKVELTCRHLPSKTTRLFLCPQRSLLRNWTALMPKTLIC